MLPPIVPIVPLLVIPWPPDTAAGIIAFTARHAMALLQTKPKVRKK